MCLRQPHIDTAKGRISASTVISGSRDHTGGVKIFAENAATTARVVNTYPNTLKHSHPPSSVITCASSNSTRNISNRITMPFTNSL